MIGFIFQFIGLRSLHWSVSVAQLVAMFLTTAIRVFLYMPFSSAMRYEKLPQNFELEWLTNELARSSLQSSETSGDTETYPNSISNLGRAISLRSQLGGIAIDHGWHSSFSVEALRLKDTIDKVLNYLWTDPKIVVRDKDQRAFEWIPYSAAGSEASCVVMKANRNWRPGSWTPWVSSTSDFESIIALWLYNLQTRQVIKDSDDEDQEPHHISRRVLWQICPMNTETCMDFDWWVRRGFNCFQMQGARYTELVGMFEDMPLMTSPLCTRRRSSIHYSESSDNIMAVVTHCSLATVCCRLLFMDFLESALKSIECLDGTTQIRSATDDIVPEIVLFENTAIDGLTSAISILSLFSLQESYALAIPILRYSRLLPNALNALSTSCDEDSRSEVLMHRIVHTYQRLARTAKYQHDWENASNAYSLLLSRADITSLYPTICNGVEEIQKVVQKWMEVELDFRDSQNATSKLLNPSPSTQGALEDIAMDRVLSAIGQMQSAQEIASICFKDLWLLDAVFLTGYARKQGPTWVVELLKEALLHERHAAIVLILLELMDEPAFKRIRSQLVELTQHTMHSYDSQGLELMLFYSTPGPSGLNRAGASLTAAARFNNAAAIRILLKAGVDIDTRDDTGCTPLMVASRYGNLEVVQMNEIRSSTVDAVPALGGMTALELAVIGNHGEIVEMLLGWGAVVNPPYRCDGTPLQLAMVEGSEQMILQLLQAGADINYPAPGGRRTALQSAVENNRFDIVRLLLGHGANVNAPASSKGYTALQIACIKGHTELIVLLLAHAADINAPAAAEEGLTALQAATLYGHRSISIDLIQRGANVNAGASSGGYTAIQAAANNGDTVIFDHLLLVGANIETSLRGQGYTVLQAACRSGHLAMVNHILAIRSIGVNEKPAKLQGMTSVQAAAMSGRIDIVELLVNRGADINADPSEFRGRTALQAAAERGDLVMVTALLKLQANINARPCETEGFTALQAASHAGHRDIVELLRANGADMNAPPCLDKGRTALQAAAEMGHLGVVQYLLSEGAYANERPAWRHGVTAWQIAYANGYDEVAAILAQAGAIRDLEDIDDSYIDSGWVAVYSAELPDWANSPSMERASSPNGLPDTPYYRVRADIDFKEDTELPLHGHSRLQSAAAAGDELLVAELHRARHDLNRHSCLIQSLTPLQTAAKAGHDAVVSQLLAYGADANNPRATIGGHTALEAASKGGHLAVVRRLITAGANVNAENPPEGKSALQLASANGHYPVVEELLDAGAEVNFMSTEVGALTPLQAAVENGWEEIAGLLRAAGARDSVN
ncbi:hypothetical protein MMC19_001617 [Ptychographa xylographoides]|nr:hypothetical protein [Ptychographa xylographoides]